LKFAIAGLSGVQDFFRSSNFCGLLLALLYSAGCVQFVADRCPTCAVVDGRRILPLTLEPDARRLFVLVPGALGFGWEWDDAVATLLRAPGTDFVVFWWNPWGSLARATRDFTSTLESLLFRSPNRITEFVVVAHSAAGLFAAYSAARLHVPLGRHLTIATVGAPLAGMSAMPYSGEETPHSPTFFTIIGRFSHYAPPAPRVEFIEFVTSYPKDPVMRPRGGHQPADPNVGPPGRKRVVVGHTDHNAAVAKVIRQLLERKIR
jgi:hypothetical protein